MNLLVTIERHLRRRSVPPSRFGREATGDPRFVFDLRRGREPRAETAARVLDFIARSDEQTVHSEAANTHAAQLVLRPAATANRIRPDAANASQGIV